jgi:hypothetical protein
MQFKAMPALSPACATRLRSSRTAGRLVQKERAIMADGGIFQAFSDYTHVSKDILDL